MLRASSPIWKITWRSLIFYLLVVIPWSWRRAFFAGIWSLSRIPRSFRTSKTCASAPAAWPSGRSAFWRMRMPTRCWNSWRRFAKLDGDISPSWHIWVALAILGGVDGCWFLKWRNFWNVQPEKFSIEDLFPDQIIDCSWCACLFFGKLRGCYLPFRAGIITEIQKLWIPRKRFLGTWTCQWNWWICFSMVCFLQAWV